MFYDDAFKTITESSVFSEKAVLTVGSNDYNIFGFFCSGNYGMDAKDRYTTKKTVPRQTFKMSALSMPEGITSADCIKKGIVIRNQKWIVRDVIGNDSGILSLDLIAAKEEQP